MTPADKEPWRNEAPAAFTAGAWPPADGKPYMPSNGMEGECFQAGWCVYCARDAQFRKEFEETGDPTVDGCEILAASMRGVRPKEWFYRNGEPVCTAYTEDPACPVRCPLTLEMFP